jgi:hypothetical protein
MCGKQQVTGRKRTEAVSDRRSAPSFCRSDAGIRLSSATSPESLRQFDLIIGGLHSLKVARPEPGILQFAGRTYRRSRGIAQSPRLRCDTPPPQGWRQSIPMSFSSGRSCHTSRLRRRSASSGFAFREEGALRPGIEMRTRHQKIQARLAESVQVAVLLGNLPTRLPRSRLASRPVW